MNVETRPTCLNELVGYLQRNPAVRFECAQRPDVEDLNGPCLFECFKDGLLWFRNQDGGEHHLPLNCGKVGAESGVKFFADRFTFTKFGIRVDVFYEEVTS